MNKSQFIEALAAHYEGDKRAASKALGSVVDMVTRQVAKGEKVAITGFGAFEKTIRPSRMVRNPATGQRVRAKKSAVPKFRAGAEFKNVVSGAKKLPKLSAASASTPAKKAAPSSRGTAKKSAAKRTAAKTSPARRTAKTSPAKKTTAKKTPAKKAVASRSSARKSTASKSTAKKTAAPRSASKSTARKTAPKKRTAKKS
ncbi:MAG: HU family DNA-binding protein [Nocardioidaceae bacterium]|nr:HU family DNA-binding protein [Nocardioidaceae bacterium]